MLCFSPSPPALDVVADYESNHKREQQKDDARHAQMPEQDADVNDLRVLQDDNDEQQDQCKHANESPPNPLPSHRNPIYDGSASTVNVYGDLPARAEASPSHALGLASAENWFVDPCPRDRGPAEEIRTGRLEALELTPYGLSP